MLRIFKFWSKLDPQRKSNIWAGSVAIAAIGFLRLEAAPIPAGSETIHRVASKAHAVKLNLAAAAPKPVETTIAATSESVSTAPLTAEELSRQTLERKLAAVKQGIEFLKKTPDYTAQFNKQELVSDELSDEQQIFMKVRHEPFSIYLKWLSGEVGREVLFVDGANDGEMIVRSGGWKGRLGPMSLDPDGSLAMREARYPVTKAGLLELALMIEEFHVTDLATSNFTRCEQLVDQDFDGRSCHCYLLEYKDAAGSPIYRKSITLIDKEWSIPVYIKNFTWPTPDLAAADETALDEGTLIECYSYAEVKFRQQLANSEFDRENEEYRLR